MLKRATITKNTTQKLVFYSLKKNIPIVNKLEINSKSFKKHNFILGICQNCGLAQLIKPIDPISVKNFKYPLSG